MARPMFPMDSVRRNVQPDEAMSQTSVAHCSMSKSAFANSDAGEFILLILLILLCMQTLPRSIAVFRSPHAKDIEDLTWFPPVDGPGMGPNHDFFDGQTDLRRLKSLYVGFFTRMMEPIVLGGVERLRCSFGSATLPARVFDRVTHLRVDQASAQNDGTVDLSTAFPNLVFLDTQASSYHCQAFPSLDL